MRVLYQLLAKQTSHLPVVQSFLMLIQLTQHRAQLQMALAHVPQFEQLGGDVELLSGFIHISRLGLGSR